jgi:hypothetical protein
VINKPFKVGQDRNDDDVSLFLLHEFVVHARLADADLGSEDVVEIAEHLERIEDNEEVAAEGAGESGDGESAIADLEEVVDAAVASAQAEESDSESADKRR